MLVVTFILHYWSLTIRMFNVISRTHVVEESYPSAEIPSAYSGKDLRKPLSYDYFIQAITSVTDRQLIDRIRQRSFYYVTLLALYPTSYLPTPPLE